MMRQIIAFRAAMGRPGESTHRQTPLQRSQRAGRPGTALEQFLERWTDAGLSRTAVVPIVWLRRLRHRHELANLTAAQLRDVGLNPDHVRRESEKPFWMA